MLAQNDIGEATAQMVAPRAEALPSHCDPLSKRPPSHVKSLQSAGRSRRGDFILIAFAGEFVIIKRMRFSALNSLGRISPSAIATRSAKRITMDPEKKPLRR